MNDLLSSLYPSVAIMRFDAEYSSRPIPPPPSKMEAGELKLPPSNQVLPYCS